MSNYIKTPPYIYKDRQDTASAYRSKEASRFITPAKPFRIKKPEAPGHAQVDSVFSAPQGHYTALERRLAGNNIDIRAKQLKDLVEQYDYQQFLASQQKMDADEAGNVAFYEHIGPNRQRTIGQLRLRNALNGLAGQPAGGHGVNPAVVQQIERLIEVVRFNAGRPVAQADPAVAGGIHRVAEGIERILASQEGAAALSRQNHDAIVALLRNANVGVQREDLQPILQGIQQIAQQPAQVHNLHQEVHHHEQHNVLHQQVQHNLHQQVFQQQNIHQQANLFQQANVLHQQANVAVIPQQLPALGGAGGGGLPAIGGAGEGAIVPAGHYAPAEIALVPAAAQAMAYGHRIIPPSVLRQQRIEDAVQQHLLTNPAPTLLLHDAPASGDDSEEDDEPATTGSTALVPYGSNSKSTAILPYKKHIPKSSDATMSGEEKQNRARGRMVYYELARNTGMSAGDFERKLKRFGFDKLKQLALFLHIINFDEFTGKRGYGGIGLTVANLIPQILRKLKPNFASIRQGSSGGAAGGGGGMPGLDDEE